MVTKSKLIRKRMLVCLLAMTMIIPQVLVGQTTAYAASKTTASTAGKATQKAPVFSTSSFRYITIGGSYDFNIKNKITGSSYNWNSSNEKVATVSNMGVVKAKKIGSSVITCSITTKEKTYKLSAKVEVVKANTSVPTKKVKITNRIDYLELDETYNLNQTFEPALAKDYVNWTSSNTNIATVNKLGLVKGVGEGKVTITVTTMYGKVSDNVDILVGKTKVTSIKPTTVPTTTPTIQPSTPSTPSTPSEPSTPIATPTAVPTATPTATPIPEPNIPDKITATFGTPYVDGEIESEWDNAKVIVPKIYGKAVDESAKYRLMWNDNALYILAEIKDSQLDDSNATAYQQDSLELFMDELYDKGGSYKSDDMHYRVNFKNVRTVDSGDATRFYSKTKTTADGYIVEASIVWDQASVPANGKEIGFDISINAATNGNRDTTITIYDTTGNAYQDPSLFGKLVLEGKADGAVSGPNPYKLFTVIESTKNIYLDAYNNKDIITLPLANAETVASNPASTQAEIDSAYAVLIDAVNQLNDGSGYTKASALPLVSSMPDVFTMQNGTKVDSLASWEARKNEISGLYQYYMYGALPDTTGEVVTKEFVDSYTKHNVWGDYSWDTVVTAAANQKLIKITVTKDSKSVDFIATATFPSTTTKDADGKDVITITPPTHGAYPVMIEIGSLGESSKKYLNDHGFVTIEFDNNEIAADNISRTGDFYSLYPYGKTWGTQTGVLMAWTWGVSKILDVIDADAAGSNELKISPVNTMVNGVSRNGKSAAVAGAFDSRIKITVPSSSGTSGMGNFRYASSGNEYNYSSLSKEEFIDFDGVENGTAKWQSYQDNPIHTVAANESLKNTQSNAHWFNDNFQQFYSPEQLPFDQHYLVALATGPDRYYFMTSEVDGSDWLNAPAMYVTYLASQNIFDSLGISDNLGIHFHSTGHAFTLEDTKNLVEFANKSFYGEIDGIMDLNHLKDDTLYSLPENRDAYFDIVKAMQGPQLNN